MKIDEGQDMFLFILSVLHYFINMLVVTIN